MFSYILFEKDTGKIVSHMSTSQMLGEGVLDTPFPHLSMMSSDLEDFEPWYVRSGEILPRPPMSIASSQETLHADGVDELVLSGFPDPCEIIVNGDHHTLDGGELTLSAQTPATYEVECKHWPFLDYRFEIQAMEKTA